jgi:hypothetical protein
MYNSHTILCLRCLQTTEKRPMCLLASYVLIFFVFVTVWGGRGLTGGCGDPGSPSQWGGPGPERGGEARYQAALQRDPHHYLLPFPASRGQHPDAVHLSLHCHGLSGESLSLSVLKTLCFKIVPRGPCTLCAVSISQRSSGCGKK